jgi:hypothetical protein
MKHIDFLIKVLTSDRKHYWIGERRMDYGRGEQSSEIVMFNIDEKFTLGKDRKDIKLTDLEEIGRHQVNNIFITTPYAPFQVGISLDEFYNGFPIESNIHEFMINALNLKSKNLYDYQEMAKEKLLA